MFLIEALKRILIIVVFDDARYVEEVQTRVTENDLRDMSSWPKETSVFKISVLQDC